MKRINCRRCAYYFVTWEAGKPHGCRAYGFKSAQIPSLVVFQSSGIECSLFQEKNSKKS
ncbi:uracil-DNA glycosylase [bacterium]|nr:uracil-DNA glycosylase [bacterium]MBU1989409.1 uracil-DNA glycosylase [bacterium]